MTNVIERGIKGRRPWGRQMTIVVYDVKEECSFERMKKPYG